MAAYGVIFLLIFARFAVPSELQQRALLIGVDLRKDRQTLERAYDDWNNPEVDAEPHWESYTVPAEPTDRILDALHKIKWEQDGTLTFRRSCAHGVCGSDAMRINGTDGLACKTLIKDIADAEGAVITIEPLRHMPVQRDLKVDQTDFFDKYRKVKPFLMNEERVEEKERLQSQEERLQFDDTTNCILCASCYSACPVPAIS